MFKVKSITAVVVAVIFGLAACGGGSSDKDDSTVTTVRQKNAALKPSPGVTMPPSAPTTVIYNVPGGTGTTVPCLPPKKRVGPFCK
jgi:ABC-type glycerol-3-phosphate transport system substrate-binding protein